MIQMLKHSSYCPYKSYERQHKNDHSERQYYTRAQKIDHRKEYRSA
jgi:hypothetical protein